MAASSMLGVSCCINKYDIFYSSPVSVSDMWLNIGPIRRRSFLNQLLIPVKAAAASRFSMAKATPSASAVIETKPPGPVIIDDAKLQLRKNVLACPICYEQLIWNGNPADLSLKSIPQSSLQCKNCRKSYSGTESYLDLTLVGDSKIYGDRVAASTELFRFPLISYLYERGWRQSFTIWGGFPGPEKEFEMMKNYLKPVSGGNIIDASCGSGMFTRLFAKSELFALVIALDFSETMLKQSYDFIKQEDNFPEENVILVRADISRLPFASSSADAVHAGAALHCWPSPSAAVAEVSRVLKPGGVFIATTYILDGFLSYAPLRKTLRQGFSQVSGSFVFLSESELEDLCKTCGLVNFTCTRNRSFVMISATKPL